ncbi:MAG: hypothetical protein K6U14_09065 [Firmicutes bacterium]|nr:hypothetical protein [Alicyclobacillaceae bacterium]MCL6497761.1 hypothetical protein [Bacillota bacterium]
MVASRRRGWLGVGLLAVAMGGCGTPSTSRPTPSSVAPAPAPYAASRSFAPPAPASGFPAPGLEPLTVTALHFLTPRQGWLFAAWKQNGARYGGFFGTEDGGRRWHSLLAWRGAPPWHFAESGPNLLPIALTFSDPRHGAALVPLGAGACQAEFGLLRTDDGGRHWAVAGTVLGSDGPVSLAFATAASGWIGNGSCAGAYTSVAATRDGGRHWSRWTAYYPAKPDTPLAPTATEVAAISSQEAFLVSAYWRYSSPPALAPVIQVLSTADGGRSWTARLIPTQPLRGRVIALAFSAPGTGWVVAETGSRVSLDATTDGGRRWIPLSLPVQAGAYGPVDQVTPAIGYLVTASAPGVAPPTAELWGTDNGGQSWTPLALPAP